MSGLPSHFGKAKEHAGVQLGGTCVKIYHVNIFTTKAFRKGPAAVIRFYTGSGFLTAVLNDDWIGPGPQKPGSNSPSENISCNSVSVL
jgi:hypothetical protein